MPPSNPPPSEYILRPATAADAPAIIALVDSVYQEYGDKVCLEDADKDLLSAHEHYARLGGEFVVLEAEDRIVGIHAIVPLPHQPGACTFRRLYLHPSLRGGGSGTRLMQWAIERAQTMGFKRVEFWSDTRFSRAHRFFARLGFVQDGRVREMRDAWEPYHEYFFYRDL